MEHYSHVAFRWNVKNYDNLNRRDESIEAPLSRDRRYDGRTDKGAPAFTERLSESEWEPETIDLTMGMARDMRSIHPLSGSDLRIGSGPQVVGLVIHRDRKVRWRCAYLFRI